MNKTTGKGIKILVLDDDKDICHFLKEFLSNRGFIVKGVLSAKNAMLYVAKFKPDIAILDVYLFKSTITGIDVLENIKKSLPDCACLMVTRADDQKIILKAKSIGAADYLVKPLSLAMVERAILKIVKVHNKGRQNG